MLVGIQNASATSGKKEKKIREIQVHKLWTKVYSQKGLTATPKSTLTVSASETSLPECTAVI